MRSSTPGRALGFHAPLASAHGADSQARADSGARDACPPRGRHRVALWEAGSAGCGGLASAEAASPGTGRAGPNWALGRRASRGRALPPGVGVQTSPCSLGPSLRAVRCCLPGRLLLGDSGPLLPEQFAGVCGRAPCATATGLPPLPRARLLPRLLQTSLHRARAQVVLFPPTVTGARALSDSRICHRFLSSGVVTSKPSKERRFLPIQVDAFEIRRLFWGKQKKTRLGWGV